MLKFANLTLRRGTRLLLEDVSFTIHDGEKLGITGANGAGKSSLFALISGELQPDAGDLYLSSDQTIAHVAQETRALDTAALDHVMGGDTELREILGALEKAEHDRDGHLQAELHDRLAAIDGYTARSRAARLMHGLGFTPAQQQAAVKTLSGGWRERLNLARALMSRSDVLLLDEPTNHLDLEMRHALTLALQGFEGAMVLVSHDRHLLRSVTDEFLLVHDSTVIPFAGDLDDYPRWLTEQRKTDSCENDDTIAERRSTSRKTRRQEEVELRRQLLPLRRQAERLEQDIEYLTSELADLQRQMSDPELYEPEKKSNLMKLLQEQKRISRALEENEAAWLGVCEKLEEKNKC